MNSATNRTVLVTDGYTYSGIAIHSTPDTLNEVYRTVREDASAETYFATEGATFIEILEVL